MEDSLNYIGFQNVSSKVIEGGEHNEQTWRDDFAEAYLWLFASYANDIAELYVEPLYLYPNPVNSSIYISNLNLSGKEKIVIYDLSGKTVDDYQLLGSEIHTGNLPDGHYAIKIMKDNQVYIGRFVKF